MDNSYKYTLNEKNKHKISKFPNLLEIVDICIIKRMEEISQNIYHDYFWVIGHFLSYLQTSLYPTNVLRVQLLLQSEQPVQLNRKSIHFENICVQRSPKKELFLLFFAYSEGRNA